MCGVSVRGNRPGSHKGLFCEPGPAGNPPLPNGKTACQQPSGGGVPAHQAGVLREVSRFAREAGRWVYVGGAVVTR